jgi:hypothetical protein
VHFSLKPSSIGNTDTYIYVLGKFNNYTPSPEYLMTYNATQNVYQARILFKQGFYNYSYALSSAPLKLTAMKKKKKPVIP